MPLKDFASRQPARDIRVPELPDFGRIFKDHGPMNGAVRMTEEMTRWKQDLERQLRQSLPEQAAATVTATAPTTEVLTDTSVADALAAHIAATAVHGATGAVVGTTNEQSLEKKIIGLNEPRYGRFSPLIQRNSILTGQTVVVPQGFSMIIPEEFIINGDLTVNGILMVVADEEVTGGGATNEFASEEVALSQGAEILNVAHGLGAQPTRFQAVLVNTSGEFGYAVDDEVPIECFMASGSGYPPFSVRLTDTTVVVRQADYPLEVVAASDGTVSGSIDLAKWVFKVYLGV